MGKARVDGRTWSWGICTLLNGHRGPDIWTSSRIVFDRQSHWQGSGCQSSLPSIIVYLYRTCTLQTRVDTLTSVWLLPIVQIGSVKKHAHLTNKAMNLFIGEVILGIAPSQFCDSFSPTHCGLVLLLKRPAETCDNWSLPTLRTPGVSASGRNNFPNTIAVPSRQPRAGRSAPTQAPLLESHDPQPPHAPQP